MIGKKYLNTFMEKTEVIQIEDFRGELPADFYEMINTLCEIFNNCMALRPLEPICIFFIIFAAE